MWKFITNSLALRIFLLAGSTALLTWYIIQGSWAGIILSCILWTISFLLLRSLFKANARKVAFMFDSIDNSDYAFKYATQHTTKEDKLVSQSLNRITQILFQAKAEAAQKEKYYELIMDSVNTGIIVLDDKGNIYQTNKEAMRLLGLSVFTHVKQLERIDKGFGELIATIQPGQQYQISFQNERGSANLSIRVSEMTLQGEHVLILAINDINKELDEKEIVSWIRLTRVLTHEIMNSVTPITSISDTLLTMDEEMSKDISNGLEIISSTGKSLIAFVESYRKFTHIPTPQPTLFYADKFLGRMIKLSQHHNNFPDIQINLSVDPDDLIIYADENLITQVMLNLLKNAMQAIGNERTDGEININAYTNESEAIIVEINNNGPIIPEDVAEHIFVPFFTTKENGSGVGLSVSRQIMRLSGGSISLKSNAAKGITTFTLVFP